MLLNIFGCLEKFNKWSYRKIIVNRGGKGYLEYGVGNIFINLIYW